MSAREHCCRTDFSLSHEQFCLTKLSLFSIALSTGVDHLQSKQGKLSFLWAPVSFKSLSLDKKTTEVNLNVLRCGMSAIGVTEHMRIRILSNGEIEMELCQADYLSSVARGARLRSFTRNVADVHKYNRFLISANLCVWHCNPRSVNDVSSFNTRNETECQHVQTSSMQTSATTLLWSRRWLQFQILLNLQINDFGVGNTRGHVTKTLPSCCAHCYSYVSIPQLSFFIPHLLLVFTSKTS